MLKTRRMQWFGYVARLPAASPARLALKESLNTTATNFGGGEKTTWVKQVTKDLDYIKLAIAQALDIASDQPVGQGSVQQVSEETRHA